MLQILEMWVESTGIILDRQVMAGNYQYFFLFISLAFVILISFKGRSLSLALLVVADAILARLTGDAW